VEQPPAIVLFRNFDLNGQILKMNNKERVQFDGPWDDTRKMKEFIIGESLPAVLTVHDPSVWFNSAMSYRVPILILAHLKGAGKHDTKQILRTVHKTLKGKVACMDIEISDETAEEEKPDMVDAVLRVAGLDESHIVFKPRAILLHIPNRYYWPEANDVDAGSMLTFINDREKYTSIMSKNYDKVKEEKEKEEKAKKGKKGKREPKQDAKDRFGQGTPTENARMHRHEREL